MRQSDIQNLVKCPAFGHTCARSAFFTTAQRHQKISAGRRSAAKRSAATPLNCATAWPRSARMACTQLLQWWRALVRERVRAFAVNILISMLASSRLPASRKKWTQTHAPSNEQVLCYLLPTHIFRDLATFPCFTPHKTNRETFDGICTSTTCLPIYYCVEVQHEVHVHSQQENSYLILSHHWGHKASMLDAGRPSCRWCG